MLKTRYLVQPANTIEATAGETSKALGSLLASKLFPN